MQIVYLKKNDKFDLKIRITTFEEKYDS